MMNKTITWHVFASYLLATTFLCYEMALQVSPNVLAHQLMASLHLNAASLSMLASCYFYTYTSMQIPAGLLFDRYNTKYLLSFAIIICAAGTFLFQSHFIAIAALGRTMMGAGSAFAFISVLFIAAYSLPARHFALLAGIAQLLAAFGAFIGEAPLSAMTQFLGWQQTLVTLAFIGMLLAFSTLLIVQSPKRTLNRAKKISIRQQLATISKNKQTWYIALYAFFNWGPIMILAALWAVPYLVSRYQITVAHAASLTGMMWIGLIFISPLLGWLSDRFRQRLKPMRWSATSGLIATLLLLYYPDLSLRYVPLLLFIIGGACSGQIVSFACVKELNKENTIATAIGFNNMAVVAGGAVLQPLVGYWLAGHWKHQMLNSVPFYQASNYQHALILVPLCFMLSWLCCFLIKEPQHSKT